MAILKGTVQSVCCSGWFAHRWRWSGGRTDGVRSTGKGRANLDLAVSLSRNHAYKLSSGPDEILFVLHTGIQWEYLPQELGFGSGMTCLRRLVAGTRPACARCGG